MKKWFDSKEAKKITVIILILCVVLVVQIFGFLHFNQHLYDVLLDYSMGQVEELSVHVEKSLQLELSHQIHTLQIIESQLEHSEALFCEHMIRQLGSLHQQTSFKMMGVSDLNGNGVDSSGRRYSIFYEHIREDIQNNEVYISNVLRNKDETLIFVAVPLKINHEICGILWGKYPLKDLVKNIEFTRYGDQYFQIIDDEGHYLLTSNRSLEHNQKPQFYRPTIWGDLRGYQYMDGTSAYDVYETVQRGESGQFYFEEDGEGRYVSYRPLEINNWYLFSVQVDEGLHGYVEEIREYAIHFFTILTIGLLTIFGIIYKLTYTMYKEIVKQNQEIQTINSMFQVTLQQTKMIPFTVDQTLEQVVLYGYPTKDVVQHCTFEDITPEHMIHKGLLDPGSLEEYQKLYQSLVVEKQVCDPVILYFQLGEKKEWVRISMNADEQENTHQMIGVLENYREQKEKDLKIENHSDDIKKIEQKSKIDFLTGLYNREAFLEKIRLALEENRQAGETSALLILDLDHFKEVNDCMGHGMGDVVLQKTANTLQNFFRKEDLVGRLGGDEFVIYARNIQNLPAFEGRIRDLNHLLYKTYHKNGKSVSVSASIGIMLTDSEHTTFEALYEKADLALYQVKQSNRNGYRIYEN